MLLHYINPSIEEETSNKQAAAAAVIRVLPVEWIEAIVGEAIECWDVESRNKV